MQFEEWVRLAAKLYEQYRVKASERNDKEVRRMSESYNG